MRKTKKLMSTTILMLIVLTLTVISTFAIFIKNVYAEDNINMSVNISDSLYIEVSENPTLTLNPLNNNIDTTSFTVTAGTNNLYGYELYMSANTTDLTRDNSDGISATIPTLDQSYSIDNFPTNKWGYKLNTATNYSPFDNTETLISSSSGPTSNSTTFDLAAKVDYDKPAGSYNLTFNFSILARPQVYYIQDFTPTMCEELASDDHFSVMDSRDGQIYTVRYINGNCWMTQNLRYIGDTSSTAPSSETAGSMIMKASTSNIDADVTISDTDLTLGDSYTEPRIHISDDNTKGVWYNYAAASAGTIASSSDSTTAVYSVCPAGWRLPTSTEYQNIHTRGYVSIFTPVMGGYYGKGKINKTYGYWWTSTANGGTARYYLSYDGTYMSVGPGGSVVFRYNGFFIRCIRSS